MRVLVTGVNGFVGQHLVRQLSEAGHTVFGSGLGDPAPEVSGLLSEYVTADLRRGWPAVPEVDGIVHLAALSAVGPSFDDPQTYIEANSSMVTHLGERLLEGKARPRVLLISSGAVYDPRQRLPISEDGILSFNSPYAVSKVLVENQSLYYASRGLDWVVVRPFNHIGPGQGSGFLLPDLRAGVLGAAKGSQPLKVGDLDTERDYTDVRDVVRAYRLLLEEPHVQARLVNVCSGRSVSGRDLLALLLGIMELEVETEVDDRRLRPSDPRRIVGDPSTVHRLTGWIPQFELRQTVSDFVASAATMACDS